MSRVHGKLMWRHLWLGDSSVRVQAETPRTHVTAARLRMPVAPVLGAVCVCGRAGKGRQKLGTLWPT